MHCFYHLPICLHACMYVVGYVCMCCMYVDLYIIKTSAGYKIVITNFSLLPGITTTGWRQQKASNPCYTNCIS